MTALTAVGNAAKEAANSTLIQKILGPTAEYLGEYFRDMAERRLTNTKKIFDVAERRLGNRINNQGSVHPKVLKEILDEGSFAEEELAAEYFGGILASSRSEVSRDDRGAYFCALVGRLNTYQLRTHYLIYSMFKANFEDADYNLADNQNSRHLAGYIPMSSYVEAMDFTPDENPNTIMGNVFFGLNREDLVGPCASSGRRGP